MLNHDLAIESMEIEIVGLSKCISELEPAVPIELLETKEQLEDIVRIIKSSDEILKLMDKCKLC